MPEILVLWVRFTFSGACLESLHLVVNEMGWCDLTPVCNEMESGVKWNEVSEEMARAQITGALCEPAMQCIEMLCLCLMCEAI